MDYEEYVRKVRDFTDFLKRTTEEFYKNKVLECCGDRKNIICKSHSSILPKRSSELDVATEFGDYFSTKVSKIRLSHDEAAERCDLSGLDATFDGVHGECCRLNRFAPVTREVITSLIKSSPAKTCCLDPLSTSLLKNFVSVLSAPITRIVNASLAVGCFPSLLKHAVLTPLIKKPSMDPEDLANYRPVSGLPFLSKLVERAVLLQLSSHRNDF